MAKSKYADAESSFRRSVSSFERASQSEKPHFAEVCAAIAELSSAKGQFGEAEIFFSKALNSWEKSIGEADRRTTTTLGKLAMVMMFQGKNAEAERTARRLIDIQEKNSKAVTPEYCSMLTVLATIHRSEKKVDVVPLFRRALAGLEKVYGPNDVRLLNTINSLTICLDQEKPSNSPDGDFLRSMDRECFKTQGLAIAQKAMVSGQKVGGSQFLIDMALTFAINKKIEEARKCDRPAMKKYASDGYFHAAGIVKELERYASFLREYGTPDEVKDVEARIEKHKQSKGRPRVQEKSK